MCSLYVAFGFGVLGITLMYLEFPLVQIIIGMFLGKQINFNLKVLLLIGGGSPEILIQRPVSAAMLIVVAASWFS